MSLRVTLAELANDFKVVNKVFANETTRVEKISRKCDGKYFIWKIVSKINYDKSKLINETSILESINHPNIMECKDFLIF